MSYGSMVIIKNARGFLKLFNLIKEVPHFNVAEA